MAAARLLVVEDNQDTLDLFTLWLSTKYRVFSYARADQALLDLETAAPDVLVLDIGMGPIDGVECLRAIRAQSKYATIPAIALTAYARECEREAFKAAGFQMVLAKPLLDEDLFSAISAVLASSLTTAA
jgi:CheY-like chemotaxis protein